MPKPKTAQQLERHLKGIANHWRIEILFCIDRNSGITLEAIVDVLRANEKTIGEHARRLHRAGLVDKKYKGRTVQHVLSPYGKQCVKFLKTFGQT